VEYVACIGSRTLNFKEQDFCYKIGVFLSQKYNIKSGNAVGADQSYAKGVNSINPKQMYLYLPYKSYNFNAIIQGNNVIYDPKKEWFDIAKKLHFNWQTLSRGIKSLHARNVGIVEDVKFVVAFPNKVYGGGTVMGMRIAETNNIHVYNLRKDKDREYFESLVL
jgi:hypothetical protein